MKRKLCLMGALLASLLVSALQMSAQDMDSCSPESIAARVSEVYATYSEAAASDLESSLDSMMTLDSQINAIYEECDQARYEAYVEEGTALLETLRAGGYVLYVRHARTDQSQTDTDTATCETQRNLSEQGRSEAAQIGEAWETLDIPVGQILSTEYCRTRETAQLAFGEPSVVPKAELEETLNDWLAQIPAEGSNMVIVGHVDMLEAATGIQVPEDVRLNEGDALVYHPLGGPMGDNGYELVGRISLRNWFDLARIAADMNAG
jgi:phosphohistidine phosphatase SixA